MLEEITDYAATHCTQCVAGWTRTSKSGVSELSCLLDNQPIPTNLADCDRYEHKNAPGSTAAWLRQERAVRR
jgi:hypothetical protein